MKTTSIDIIRNRLFEMQDEKYRDFQCRLMPTVSREAVIGVRTTLLRKYAGELSGTPEASEFLAGLPHKYYEENNLHAFLLEKIRDFNEAVSALDAFLPYVDNWATCDSMKPRVLGKHLPELLGQVKIWIASGKTYTVRFGIEMLMNFYLEDKTFTPETAAMVAAVRSDEYYINMMCAWYFATALAKQYDSVIGYLENHRIDEATHNMTIRKANESFRIDDARKSYIKSLKIQKEN